MAAPVEEQCIEVLFELLHAVGKRRRHAMQFVRRCGKAAFALDRVEHQQGLDRSSHID